MIPMPRAAEDDLRPGAADAALVARVRAGDGAARERLAREHLPRLLALCGRLGGRERAGEAVHRAFDAAFRGSEPFDGSLAVGDWLRRLALRAVVARETRRDDGAEIAPLLPTFSADGHREPAAAGVCADLRERIDRLPTAYRLVYLLRDVEQLSLAETAELLGLGPAAVRERLHAARLALCEQLERGTPSH